MQGVSIMDVLVQEQFKNTLSYALAEMAYQYPLTAEQLSGAKMLVREILAMPYVPEAEDEFKSQTLDQPLDPSQIRQTMNAPKAT